MEWMEIMKNDSYHVWLEECYLKYSNEVKHVIMRYVRDEHLAEDLLQELYARMMQRKTIPDPANPACIGYMRKAARNICFDYLRQQKRKEINHCVYPGNMDEYEGQYLDIEETFVDGEVIGTMIDSIREMENIGRSMVIERYCQNKTYTEIARELDLSVYVVKKKMKDIHISIKKKIGRDF